jgi:2-dehydro-3-deoxy-D-gluconate 5-dehydrogenase
MSLSDLSGRVAIVTGGNGGIGLGMAEGLASAGAIGIAVFLASAASDFVTGAAIPVDGGFSVQG